MSSQQIELQEFTDPVCTWCWGSEPVLRKLQTYYGDQIKIKFIMGGLVKDIREFHDRINDIGGDPDRSNRNIAKHWLEASERHGMPVETEEHPSSYPQNIAYKAAQMQSEELANKFLRRIREATATEARQTNRREVLIDLANEVGLDLTAFIKRLEDGSARKAFEKDLATKREYGVRGFLSFLVRYRDKELLLRGYQSYESLSRVIKSISEGEINEKQVIKSEEAILQFIGHFETVAPVEIQTAFDLSDDELNTVLETLSHNDNGKIIKVEAGNGSLFKKAIQQDTCDMEEGICYN